ncbi:MAG: LysR family transcriptional regulator [Paracoccaceae bacterium]|nr:LysR family transcriptional regulator [Paracoccaceae bacterium]MDE3122915.1 LysR family transcriptional regulator [Paracoccaceae bacterium]
MERFSAERMFLKVADLGSFAAAAAQLGTSSGQASKLVARLEEGLGVKLINRTTRALALTEAGIAYAKRLRPLVEDLDDLTTAVQNASTAPRGLLRLSAPVSFGTLRLAPLLSRFACAYPEIRLEVNFGDRIVNLVEEGFDAAIRVGGPRDALLKGRRLLSAHMHTVAAQGYLAARGTPARPEDLAHHDCILDTNFRDPNRWKFRGGQIVPVDGRITFSNASACLAAAEAGLGIAYVPDFVSKESIRQGRVQRLLTDHALEPGDIQILYPDGRHLPNKVRVLIDFLVGALREEGE